MKKNKSQKTYIENIAELYPKRKFDFEKDGSLITVLYYEQNPTLIEKIFFKKQLKKPRKIDLDEIGSFVWELCDGSRNVEEITRVAEEHFKEKINPAKERTELFIEQLYRAKLIELYKKIK